eukprot:m51a1_g14629 putative methylene-fatty-acyl-phospholipid synthase (252) ;mRNA; r:14990-16682
MLTNEHIRIRGLDNNDSTFYRQWFEDIARKQSDKKEKKRVASQVFNAHAAEFVGRVDWADAALWASAAQIVFNPLAWNFVARNEYRRRSLTRLFRSARAGCYFLALAIFSVGLFRDFLYHRAVERQGAVEWVDQQTASVVGYALYAVGMTLVLSSTWALGITGTFLGDYFGILLPAKVTCFPFSVTDSPMYTGSTLNFLAHAVIHRSPAGIFLTLVTLLVYKIAQVFEDSFTNMIYTEAAKKKSKGGKKSN